MIVEIGLSPSRRHKDGLVGLSIRVPELRLEYELALPFKRLYRRFGRPDPVSLDLLLFSSICYVIDKVVPRKATLDHWTRELDVTIPVSDASLWMKAGAHFEKALTFLSGDIWRLSFDNLHAGIAFKIPPYRTRRKRSPVPTRIAASAVCLFSGGLDSLAGALDLLSRGPQERLLLVGHYDMAGPASTQRLLFSQLVNRYPGRAELVQARVSHAPKAALELTLRSRSLVFLALGLYAARTLGRAVALYAPENGLIALNPPLTPSRAGSCSTRTMHPFFLDSLAAALLGIGFSNRIVNPLELKTKGEALVDCGDQMLLRGLARDTVSCSHATRRQNWRRPEAGNCGYCVPCIFRRAALHAASLDDGKEYGIDVLDGELSLTDNVASDFRAMLDYVAKGYGPEATIAQLLGSAPISTAARFADVVQRGFGEVRSLITAKATTVAIRRAAGIANVRG